MDELRVGVRPVYEVEANWKIVVENYNECLHCPQIHPELVQVVPLFRFGEVWDEQIRDDGNRMVEGATSFTISGTSELPKLPDLEPEDYHMYYGSYEFPNLMLNLHPDCGMYYIGFPKGPNHTTVVSEFLFRPETIAGPNFKPEPVVELWDLYRGRTGRSARARRRASAPARSPPACTPARIGSSTGSTRSTGLPWGAPRRTADVAADFTFIGVPIDSVGRAGGTEHGPAMLRALGSGRPPGGDAGDLDVRIRGDDRDPVTGIIGSADVLTATAAIRRGDGGGAHGRANGRSWSAAAAPCCRARWPARARAGTDRVVYIDGHLDLYDGVTSPTGEAADMPLSVALGRGPAAWVEVCGGATSRVEDVVPIGFRDPDEVPRLNRSHPSSGRRSVPSRRTRSRREGAGAVGGGSRRISHRGPAGSGCTSTSTSWARPCSPPPTT